MVATESIRLPSFKIDGRCHHDKILSKEPEKQLREEPLE